MTFYQGLATVLLRVWAAVHLIWSVGGIVSFGVVWVTRPMEADDSLHIYYMTSLASYALYLVIGAAVWIFAPRLGRRIGATAPFEEPSLRIDHERMVAIGAFLIGLYFIAEYAPQALAESIAVFLRAAQETDAERLAGGGGRYFVQWGTLGQHWASVVVALVIGLRARDFARLFSWLRTAGQYRGEGAAEKSVTGE